MKTVVVALVTALIVAATASAGAIIITSAQIKDGTIQTRDISAQAKRSLKGNRGLAGPAGPAGPVGLRGPAGLQGLQGLQGAQGVQGSPGLSGVEYVVQVGVPGEGSATATCPAGKYVIGGGASASAGFFYRSEPTDSTSWTASVDPPANVTAFAVCASLSAPPTGLAAALHAR